jgi:tetratricopeptide (TPR) repeat protein
LVRTLVCLLSAAALATVSGAQDRPKLPAEADTNDWEAYYDLGVKMLQARRPKVASKAFAWAHRLEPRRAEPPLGAWVAGWMSDPRRFELYLREDQKTLALPEVQRLDSLHGLALRRNPLAFQGLVVWAYDALPGNLAADPITQGWLAYAQLEYDEALRYFNIALKHFRRSRIYVRYLRALVFTAKGDFESVATELQAMLDMLALREATDRMPAYQSKALIQFAIGMVHAARQDEAKARAALEGALVEDLSFYPAYLSLAELSAAARRHADAAADLAKAVPIGPHDPVVHFEYGVALVRAGRAAEALSPLRQAATLAPEFAEPHFWLGEVLSATEETATAVAAYRAYLTMASRGAPLRAQAEGRLRALEASPP